MCIPPLSTSLLKKGALGGLVPSSETVNPFSLEETRSAKCFIDCNADSCNRCSGKYACWSCDQRRSHSLSWQYSCRILQR